MTISEVRAKYLEFFRSKGHAIVPSALLVPENDPTTLFTGSGMQPMVPYLLGAKHPSGTRLADSQKCFRAQDIEEVGDNRHTTFFEMLGNWSLGDYFKKEQLRFVFEFLTANIGLDPHRLYFTAFAGDEINAIPRDTESAEILKGLFLERDIEAKEVVLLSEELGGKNGMQGGRIFYYNAKKNWWSRAGVPENMPKGEPGGPDCEIFFDFHPEAGERCIRSGFGDYCHPNCDCGRFMEIGNSVFMEYRKVGVSVEVKPLQDCRGLTSTNAFEKLPQRNVDFGGGLERIAAASNGNSDVFLLDTFAPTIRALETASGKFYADETLQRSFRIVAEHLRASVFLIADGAHPSNTDQGYFTRRLLRRAVRHLDLLGIQSNTLAAITKTVVSTYADVYPSLLQKKQTIEEEVGNEEQKFRKTLDMGLKEFERVIHPLLISPSKEGERQISGADAFMLFSSYGLPIDMIIELAPEKGLAVDKIGFDAELERHHTGSRAGTDQKFKGGLADTSEMSVKYHTATHLLHQALRDVLGNEVQQKGSNITPERLRFDFAFGRKMTDEEKKRVEDIVNAKIQAKLPMQKVILPFAEAEKTGALHFFGEKYGDEVNVYFIGNSLESAYSKEFCGGPHVTNTGVLGAFKISKEEAVSAGVRRIKAILK
ncbi:MAG: alanyl-tRNA synthetase [Parcubacteria group bacterium GW2011_GWA2_49_9]|nr:MAG: alanyl-tRNA synthetase [Parcubacteria group bacterium GW2011_GWA2_49_9]